jgi:hypothetical protein
MIGYTTATQLQFPITVISLSWTHVTERSSENWGNSNATHGKTEKLNFQAMEHASLLTIALLWGFLVSAVIQHALVIHLFLMMAQKFDKAANFVFVKSNEQEPGIYDKHHPDYARQDKTDLAWGRISHETKRLSSFKTIKVSQFKLSEKYRCTLCFLFLILYLSILLYEYIIYFTYISVLNATYYIVTLLPHYMVQLYTTIIRCFLSC